MKLTVLRGLLFFCCIPAAFGSLVLSSTVAVSGTGFGTVATLITIQGAGGSIETGCVGSNSSQIGSVFDSVGVCTGSGADVGTGASHLGPQPLSAGGVTSAANFAIVFNANQSAGGPISITNLQVSFYTPTGTFLYQTSGFSCPGLTITGACDFTNSQSGTGSSGFPFSLDATQQAAATAAGVFSNTANLVGIAAAFTPSSGGAETLYLSNFVPTIGTPEPQSFVLGLSGALLLFGCVAWKRKQRA